MLIPNTRRLIDLIVEKGLIKALRQLDKKSSIHYRTCFMVKKTY